jgi:hypothetical protein
MLKARKIAEKAKTYYNPDNDPNYKLLRMDDESLTPKQKRIKYRIQRLQRRAFKLATQDVEQKK